MADRERDERRKRTPPGGPEDQLSPSRALRESVGTGRSQRLGDSGPVANPEVSFPEDPREEDEPEL
jgi:hypothetical protein